MFSGCPFVCACVRTYVLYNTCTVRRFSACVCACVCALGARAFSVIGLPFT